MPEINHRSQTRVNSQTGTHLAARLGLFDATMVVMGGIVGSGIFINPYVVALHVHTPFLILGVWILGGILALLGAFIWAELATRMPSAGGQYLYLREAYHPSVAFLYGWVLLLVTQTGGMAAVAVTFAKYFREISGSTIGDGPIAAAQPLRRHHVAHQLMHPDRRLGRLANHFAHFFEIQLLLVDAFHQGAQSLEVECASRDAFQNPDERMKLRDHEIQPVAFEEFVPAVTA